MVLLHIRDLLRDSLEVHLEAGGVVKVSVAVGVVEVLLDEPLLTLQTIQFFFLVATFSRPHDRQLGNRGSRAVESRAVEFRAGFRGSIMKFFEELYERSNRLDDGTKNSLELSGLPGPVLCQGSPGLVAFRAPGSDR